MLHLYSQVEVIAGKDKGKQGEVLKVLRSQNKVVVKGANLCVRRVAAPDPKESGSFEMEKGIQVSNVSLVDPVTR